MKKCLHCNNDFEGRSNRLYCSKKCYASAKALRHRQKYGVLGRARQNENWKCEQCGEMFKPKRRHQKYCSSECSATSRRKYLSIPDCLEDASRKLDKNIGYVRVYCPMHPKANTWGYVYEHRLIAEGILGRYLEKDEHVHHINSKRWDNRPENLQVLSASEHGKIKK